MYNSKEQKAFKRFVKISATPDKPNKVAQWDSEEEVRFHLLVSSIPDALWTIDRNNHVLYASDNIRSITGYTPEEEYAMGPSLNWIDRVHPEEAGQYRSAINSLFEENNPFNIEYRIKTKDSRWVWVHDRALVTYSENGKKYASGMLSDITERKQVDLHIKELKEKYESLIKNIPVVVYSTLPDETSTMTFISERWSEWTGYSPRETYNEPQTWLKSVHPEDRHRSSQSYIAAYKEETEYLSEYRLVNRKTGRVRWVVDYGVPVMNISGAIDRFDGIMLDITERMEAELELRSAKDTLEMRVKERTAELSALSRKLVEAQENERRMVASELHDQIGQSLTALKISLDRATRSPEQKAVGLVEAKKIAKELLTEVRDLSLNLRPPMLDDLGLLPALLWYFERYSNRTKIAVDFRHRIKDIDLPSEIGIAAYRIIQEALTNVARHTHVKNVTIDAFLKNGLLWIRVEDMGEGFDAGSLPFENSIGLHRMQERALLLGGDVTICSTPGCGTCITAKLPVERARRKE